MRLLPHKHVLQYDWLVHFFTAMSLLFPIVFLFSAAEANPWQLVLLYPLFILQWYHGFWQTDRDVYGHFFFLVLLASWAMYLHWSGAVMFFYGQIFLLRLPKLWQASIGFFLEAILVSSLAWWWDYSPTFIAIFSLLIIFGGHANYLFFSHNNAQRDLLVKQEELEYVSRERERERIARDLHDILGHTLSTIALKAELAEKLLKANLADKAQSELTDISEAARTALADVRQTVSGYRSGNLRSELAMAKNSLSAAGMEVEMPDQLPVRISRELENLLSLVIREAVTNIIRHAKASNCRIQLFNRNACWQLIVSDDGVGWNGSIGNGLSGMKERISFFSGKLTLDRTDKGTKLVANIPQRIEGDVDA
jgi:two-component system sensor histidine kinase DesK